MSIILQFPGSIAKILLLKCLLLLLLMIEVKKVSSTSLESCLSAYAVNSTENFDVTITPPIDCLCTNTDLVCINLLF